jgi:16S rRNA pseudouridine516 synthase
MSARSLDRILQSQGFGTRKQCRELIRRGLVDVAGERVRDPAREFVAEDLEVEVDGQPWRCRQHLYLALHKPEGFECSRRPDHHDSVFALLPVAFAVRGVQPAGRLDQDSTGLLLLSDDGAFLHRMSSPRRHVTKTYLATIRDDATEELVARLLAGVQLHREPEPLAALDCRVAGPQQLELTLAQGRYHQVKRMLAAAGTSCTALHRTAVGGLRLDALGLEPGQWRELEADELLLASRPQ